MKVTGQIGCFSNLYLGITNIMNNNIIMNQKQQQHQQTDHNKQKDQQDKPQNEQIKQKQQNNCNQQERCGEKDKENKQNDDQNQNKQDEENEDDQDNEDDQEREEKWKKIEKPQKCINLYMIDFNQCDGKKCTGRKMQRFNMLKSIKEKQKKKKFRGVVLSAFGQKPVSIEDLDLCVKNGICVIDCSWNRIEETSQFRFKNERILPYVVAGNPVNYGKPFQLSCVEALTTALCAINYVPQAEYIMSKFGWADGFWSINSRIKEYGNCKNVDQLQKLSQQIQQSENTMKQRSYDISDSDSDSNSNSSNEQQQGQQQQNQTEEPQKVGLEIKIEPNKVN